MPLDPRIALAGTVPQVPPVDLGQALLTAAQLRGAAQQAQLRQLALAEAQTQQAQQAQFEAYLRSVLQGAPPAPPSLIAPPLPGQPPYAAQAPAAAGRPGAALASPGAGARAQMPPTSSYTRAPLAMQAPALQDTTLPPSAPSALNVDWRKAWSLWPRGGLQVLGAMRAYEQGNTLALLEPIQQGLTALRQIQGTIHDQTSLDRARTRLQHIPDVAALFPQTYTPEAMAQLETRLMPLAERLTLQMQAEKLRIEQLKEQRELQKSRLLEGVTSGLSGRLAPSAGTPSRGVTPATPAARAVQEQIVSEAQRQGVEPAFALTFADVESQFQHVTGDNGQAAGYFQLWPRAATDAGKVLGMDPEARWTREGNVPLGVQYAKQVLDRAGGDPAKAFALYNWGTPTYQGKGDPHYVEKAMQTYAQYRGQAGAGTPESQLQTYDRQIQELDDVIARSSVGAIDQDIARVLTQLNERRSALRAERGQLADRLREERQVGRETRRDIGTLKRQAGADIRDSALTPEQKAHEFAALAEITSPEAAETFATRAASLPAAKTFGEEREALSQQSFSLKYDQLDPGQQALVNQRLQEQKETYQLYPTETGLFLVGMKSAQVWQIDPSAPGGKRLLTPDSRQPLASLPTTGALPLGAGVPSPEGVLPPGASVAAMPELPQPPSPGPPVAPPGSGRPTPPLATPVPQPPLMAPAQGRPLLAQPPLPPPAEPAIVARPPVLTPTMPPSGVPTPAQAGQQGLSMPSQVDLSPAPSPATLAYEELSPLAREVSTPTPPPRSFGAKPRTTEQQRAYGFGSRALQAQEQLERLEAAGEYGDTFWHTARQRLQALSPTEAAGLGAVLGGTLGLRGAGILGTVVGGTAGAVAGLGVRIAAPALNLLDTEAQRSYLANKAAFLGAVLRKESGAAIAAHELEQEEKRYFPQVGDSQTQRESKRLLREQIVRGLAAEAGQPLLMPQVPRPAPRPAAPPVAPEHDIPEDPGARRATTLKRLTTLPPAQIERGDADVSLQFLQQSGLTATELVDAVGLERFYAIKRRMDALNRPR